MFCRSTASAIAQESKVVLVGLHEWLHELSGNQLHVVALFSQNTSEEVSAWTSLHPNQTGLHVRGEGDELLQSELLPQYHLACCAQRYEVKSSLAEINANRTNLRVDDPPSTYQHDPPNLWEGSSGGPSH
jgi:hypothetical protein